MDVQREHGNDNWGRVVFIVLLFFLICAFTKSFDSKGSKAPKYVSATELKSNLPAIYDYHRFRGLNKLDTFIYTAKLKLFISYQDIISENKIIDQKFLSLQKTQLLIKPVLHYRFYYRFHIIDTGDLPHLS
jgi:hypothetical protein